jgi:hypothetical protein
MSRMLVSHDTANYDMLLKLEQCSWTKTEIAHAHSVRDCAVWRKHMVVCYCNELLHSAQKPFPRFKLLRVINI